MKRKEKVTRYKEEVFSQAGRTSEETERAREERRRKRQELVEKRTKDAERQAARRSPRRRRYVIISTAAVLFVTAFVGRTFWNLWKLQAEKLEAEESLRILREEKAELDDKLEQVESDEYIEQEARSELHMIRPGEVLYIIPEDEDDESSGGGAAGGSEIPEDDGGSDEPDAKP